MVLKVYRGRMFVAAFEGTPSTDTQLFATPFRGVDVHGNAMGACRVNKPKQQRMQDRDEWENAFFKSKFNQAPTQPFLSLAMLKCGSTSRRLGQGPQAKGAPQGHSGDLRRRIWPDDLFAGQTDQGQPRTGPPWAMLLDVDGRRRLQGWIRVRQNG